ncbi:MAG: endonuclease/exonuclease/phosphatase family protein [Thermoanaerobaculia bacterium]
METLRVLSYNIHGRAHRLSRRYLHWIAEVIESEQPDVVGLQEVHRGGWTARREDQAKSLAKLTGMEYRFGRSFGRPGDEIGNAVLTRGEIRSAEVIPLPAPGVEPRTVLHSRIGFHGLDGNDSEIDFYVTHLAHGFRSSGPARSLQAHSLLERLRQSRGPFVLVGDFNAPPHAPELKTLMAAEIFRLCGKDMACTHRILRQRIDWVVADPGWTTAESRVVQAGPSDHWPVLVELHRTAPGERR